MRHLLLALALGLPAGPALAAADELGGYSESAFVPDYQLHRNHHYLGDGVWVPRVFSRDDGYFQGRGGGVRVANGRAVFEYDRDYLYDFPRGSGAGAEALGFVGNEMLAEEEDCRIVRVPDGRSGSAEVRICS
jgi:hypothetical protein